MGEAKISYEIIGFCGIVLCACVQGGLRKKNFIFNKIYLFPVIYSFIYTVSTVISATMHHTAVYWTALFGVWRLTLLFIFFTQEIWDERLWEHFLNIIIAVNSISVLVQVLFPCSFYFFEDYYIKQSYVITWFEETCNCIYRRTFGLTSMPSILSYMCTIAMIHYLCKYIKTDMKVKDYFFLTLSIVCGISTAMKASFLGIVVCVMAVVIIAFFFQKKDKVKYIYWSKIKTISLAIIIIIVCISGYFLDMRGVAVSEYIKKSINIIAALQTRYDMSMFGYEGEVYETAMRQIEVLESYENLVGVGATTPYGESVRDSEWFMMIHNAGIIGMLLIALWIGILLKISFRDRNIEMMLNEIIIFIFGTAICSVFQFTGIVLISYIWCSCSDSFYFREQWGKQLRGL